MWNIPNILTAIRILLIPVFMVFFYLPSVWTNFACAIVFTAAALTDWFDGYLARRWRQVSAFGAFLDPVADKLMVAVALILLVERNPTPALAIPAIVIISREITVSALREWMAELGARAQVAVSVIGKFKTAVQMIAIVLLLYQDDLWGIPIYITGFVLLYVAAVLTIWSMFVYVRAAWPNLTDDRVVGKPDDQ